MHRPVAIDKRRGATYGAGKMVFTIRGARKMKVSLPVFVLGVLAGAAVCPVESVGARVMSDLKYLEHLNDLDVRNVEPELDDIHQQWPFVSIARPVEEDEQEREEEEEQEGVGQKYIDPESLLQAAVLTRLELGNKHSQNFREMVFDRMDEGLRQMKDNSERGDHLSQYRRYKPFEQDNLEEARMYPDKNEEEPRFSNDDTAYLNTDPYFVDEEAEEEEEEERHRLPFPRPFFPRIAPVETPTFGDTFLGTLEEEEQQPDEPETSQKEVVVESHKPKFHQLLFPRIAPVDIHENYKIDDIGGFGGKHEAHDRDEYKFKEGEEFPEIVKFDEVPVVQDLSEFGVKPDDPRFYRDADKTEEKTSTAKIEDPVHPYILNSAYISKAKASKDFQKESPTDQMDNREVQVVPVKPDQEEDSAGVYIIAIVAGISAAATVGLMAVGIGWYKWANRTPQLQRLDGCISD
ncbi:uncharacterized protein LOC126747375 isoform X2 [Anthonomus grandis grandis]|uniref:uncharacterized protein LOC126747375 isoform X2 n=1 Tax=Anthonomus grandis grandis TaxID=2921223 RepID=UPI0021659452|nr:uncharacterized protein LOC126747375 isoform X2 [Anthonomus grandis grandis]